VGGRRGGGEGRSGGAVAEEAGGQLQCECECECGDYAASSAAEPFLEDEQEHEREGWPEVDAGSDRHLDAGPVSNVSLGRSPSGRLPPAYGEQI
jgi:hypothetical protein